MAYCYLCGRYWIVATGRYVIHAVMALSSNDVQEPIDLVCGSCSSHTGRYESAERAHEERYESSG